MFDLCLVGIVNVQCAKFRDKGNHNCRTGISSPENITWQMKVFCRVEKDEIFIWDALFSHDQKSISSGLVLTE